MAGYFIFALQESAESHVPCTLRCTTLNIPHIKGNMSVIMLLLRAVCVLLTTNLQI